MFDPNSFTISTALLILFIISSLTTIFTEAIKHALGDRAYSANTIAGLIAVLITVIFAVCYCILFEIVVTVKVVVFFIILIPFAWLCAMEGYDKVKQAILQIKEYK